MIVVAPYDCCLTLERILSAKKLNSLTYKLSIVPFNHNPYVWKSHQIWCFFTFLADLAFCVPRAHPALESGYCKTIPYLQFLQRPTIFMVRIQSHASSSIFFITIFEDDVMNLIHFGRFMKNHDSKWLKINLPILFRV